MPGHRIINPFGQVISVTLDTLLALEERDYVYRDHASGLMQLDPKRFAMFSQAEREMPWFQELGAECQGARWLVCTCPACLNPDGQEGDQDDY